MSEPAKPPSCRCDSLVERIANGDIACVECGAIAITATQIQINALAAQLREKTEEADGYYESFKIEKHFNDNNYAARLKFQHENKQLEAELATARAEVKRLEKVVLAFEDSTGWSADQVTKTSL